MTLNSADATPVVEPVEDHTFTLLTVSAADQDNIAKCEREVMQKYRSLIKDLTKEEELEILGFSLQKLFPTIERDVEKLIIDLNLVIFRYMQSKMEGEPEVRAELIRSTVSGALRKVSAALFFNAASE